MCNSGMQLRVHLEQRITLTFKFTFAKRAFDLHEKCIG